MSDGEHPSQMCFEQRNFCKLDKELVVPTPLEKFQLGIYVVMKMT